MSIPVVREERAQRRSAFPSITEVVPSTAAQQSPFLPFALLLLYVILVYLRPFEYLQYRETFRDVPLLPIVMGIMLIAWLPVQGKRFDAPQYALMMGLLFCIPISIISAARWFGGALDAFIDFVPVVVLFIVAATLTNSPRRFRQMFFVLGAVSAVIAWHGIDQAKNGIGWSGVLPNQQRITYVGFLNDPNDLAMALLIALPMTLSFVRRGGNKLLAIAGIAAAAEMLYGVYLTNSRGAMIALAAMLVVFALLRYGWKRGALLVPVLIALLIFVAPSRVNEISPDEESATGRVEAWYEGFQMLKKYRLFGVGKGQFVEHHERTAHNSFILAAAELGIIGYFFWVSMVALSAMMLLALLRSPAPDPPEGAPQSGYTADSWLEYQRLARILMYSLTGCMTAAFFLSRSYVILLYVLLALIAGLYQSAEVRWVSLPTFAMRTKLGQLVVIELGSLVTLWLTTRILLAYG